MDQAPLELAPQVGLEAAEVVAVELLVPSEPVSFWTTAGAGRACGGCAGRRRRSRLRSRPGRRTPRPRAGRGRACPVSSRARSPAGSALSVVEVDRSALAGSLEASCSFDALRRPPGPRRRGRRSGRRRARRRGDPPGTSPSSPRAPRGSPPGRSSSPRRAPRTASRISALPIATPSRAQLVAEADQLGASRRHARLREPAVARPDRAAASSARLPRSHRPDARRRARRPRRGRSGA